MNPCNETGENFNEDDRSLSNLPFRNEEPDCIWKIDRDQCVTKCGAPRVSRSLFSLSRFLPFSVEKMIQFFRRFVDG